MNYYFVPNVPDNTTLVSSDGMAHYRVTTTKTGSFRSPFLTRITRLTGSLVDDVPVGDIHWRRWGGRSVVKSTVFDGHEQNLQIRELLYKLGSTFSTARYFLGNDNEEYRWKYNKCSGYILTHRGTGDEVARYVQTLVTEGHFRGKRKGGLRIHPSTLDVDIIVLTFIILEKKRQDAASDEYPIGVQNRSGVHEGGVEMGNALGL